MVRANTLNETFMTDKDMLKCLIQVLVVINIHTSPKVYKEKMDIIKGK